MAGFKRATRADLKLRMALIGPAGSGKTYTALEIASGLGSRIAVIDTEHGSARRYAGRFEFDSVEFTNFDPRHYMRGIGIAESEGYDVLVIDSLSHAWMGKGGLLEQVDQAKTRSGASAGFAAWKDATPLHNELVETMLGCRLHLIVTMRTKVEYVVEKDDKGRSVPRKVGLQPQQREGLDYEFDVVCDLDHEHNLIVGKTRFAELDGLLVHRAGSDLGQRLRGLLDGGQPPLEVAKEPEADPDPAPDTAPEPEAEAEPEPADAMAHDAAAVIAAYSSVHTAEEMDVANGLLAELVDNHPTIADQKTLWGNVEAAHDLAVARVEAEAESPAPAEEAHSDADTVRMLHAKYGGVLKTQDVNEAKARLADARKATNHALKSGELRKGGEAAASLKDKDKEAQAHIDLLDDKSADQAA